MSEIGIELLERYLAGKATHEECQRVEAWLAEDPRRWAELTALREGLEGEELSDKAVEEALAEVWDRIAADVGAGEGRPPRLAGGSGRGPREFSLSRARMRPLIGVAAAVVLAIGGGLLAMALLQRRAGPSPTPVTAATAPAERAAFQLSDGTRVMLGVASTLRYPRVFPAEGREVFLEGEAYFDVAHEEERPFVVRAGGVVAKDLGTQFTVRAYREDPGARVVVREGRVAIRAPGDGPERVVNAGELGRLGEGGVPTVEPADTVALFAWTEGRLVFDNTPLREALPELGRWFDLDFRMADDSLGGIPLTATLKAQPTPDVLSILSASLGLRHRQLGRTVTLYSEPISR